MEWCNLLADAFLGAPTPPPTWTAYGLIKDFVAPLFVAILGFGGVIVTLRQNAHLAEEGHRREIEVREKIVRNGLFVELEDAIESLEENIKATSELAPNAEDVLMRVPSRITSASSPDLGLLTGTEVRAMFGAQKGIDGYRTRILTASKEGPSTTDDIVTVPAAVIAENQLSESTLKFIKTCLESLNVPSDMPILGEKSAELRSDAAEVPSKGDG